MSTCHYVVKMQIEYHHDIAFYETMQSHEAPDHQSTSITHFNTSCNSEAPSPHRTTSQFQNDMKSYEWQSMRIIRSWNIQMEIGKSTRAADTLHIKKSHPSENWRPGPRPQGSFRRCPYIGKRKNFDFCSDDMIICERGPLKRLLHENEVPPKSIDRFWGESRTKGQNKCHGKRLYRKTSKLAFLPGSNDPTWTRPTKTAFTWKRRPPKIDRSILGGMDGWKKTTTESFSQCSICQCNSMRISVGNAHVPRHLEWQTLGSQHTWV